MNSPSDEESVPSYDDDEWYDDGYWYGDVPSCGGMTNSHGVMRVLIGGMMNSGGVTRILVV